MGPCHVSVSRRQFLRGCGLGLGSLALGSLLQADRPSEELDGRTGPALEGRGSAPAPCGASRAQSVIFLYMSGGPSQLDLFDYKPVLQQHDGQPVPESLLRQRRFAFMDLFTQRPPVLHGTRRKFTRHGRCGTYVSELLPHIAGIVDDIAIVRSVVTDAINHTPANLFLNTGSTQIGRPSMGAWVTYGLGSMARDLPGYVVLQSGPNPVNGGAPNWGSGFLPSRYQGIPFRAGAEPIGDLTNPSGISASCQRQTIDTIGELNALHQQAALDDEITTRTAAYEMAYQMQSSAPELMRISDESAETLRLYGAEPGKVSFANNCLLARRLVEHGVRFVQLFHSNWDHHGSFGLDLEQGLERCCREVDQASAALVQDLKRRGLLDQTLVVWGGEFGRTPMAEPREKPGRNHHLEAATMWLAGGGIRAGSSLGATDELGFLTVEDRVHVHDLQATILHLLGIDHTKLTYRFQGREFRLTDVGGSVVRSLLT